jgi:hypothetical protein
MTKSRGIRNHRRELIGQSFGRWQVIDKAPRDRFRMVQWLCECQCGTIRNVSENSLIRGVSSSCGCLNREVCSRRAIHGMTRTKIYQCWRHMLNRCYRSKDCMFVYYGGRGIKVCERWHKFVNFWDDMGTYPEDGRSLDRINNDGDYEPGNCKWSTHSEQVSNQQHRICSHCGKECKNGTGLSRHNIIHTRSNGYLQDSNKQVYS